MRSVLSVMSLQNDEALLPRKLPAAVSSDGRVDPHGDLQTVAKNTGGRLLVVANRLPVTISKGADGAYTYKMSSGGLVSALLGVRGKLPFLWFGWLGKDIPEADQSTVATQLMEQHGCIPVFLPQQLAEDHYNGFSNDVLWPLLHYESQLGGVIGPAFLGAGTGSGEGGSVGSGKQFETRLWEAYKQANKMFASVVVEHFQTGDSIWVHDYHLMVLPFYLRQALADKERRVVAAAGTEGEAQTGQHTPWPRPTIAWFLHTPWPASDIYRVLPVRANIIRGLLECDLLGFHTHDYARHFTASAPRVLQGVQATPGALWYHDRRIAVGVFPIGIEPESFEAVQQSSSFEQRLAALGQHYAGVKLIVAVDRLDPIKGIPHRLLGYEAFLHAHPEWVGKVTLLQVAVPSRTDVPAYQALAAACSTLVGRINGTFGSLGWTPVQYLFRSIDPTELTALYSLADCCLITSLRDGMNLVSMEYIACTAAPNKYRSAPGVLTLSEFAGSAQSLAGAVRCSPWDAQDIARAIHSSLTMSDKERTMRHQLLHAYVKQYTSAHWAVGFVEAMGAAGPRTANGVGTAEQGMQPVAEVDIPSMEDLQTCFKSSSSRLFLFSFEHLFLARGVHSFAHGRPARSMPMQTGQRHAAEPDVAPEQSSLGAVNGLTYRSAVTPAPVGAGMNHKDALSMRVLAELSLLAADPGNIVVVCAAKADQQAMLAVLDSIPELCLIAEGGAAVRVPSTLSACSTEQKTALQGKWSSVQQNTSAGQRTGETSTGQHEPRASLSAIFPSALSVSTNAGTQVGGGWPNTHGSPAASVQQLPAFTQPPVNAAQRTMQMAVHSRPPTKPGPSLSSLRTDVGTALSAPFSPARFMSPGRMPLLHATPGTPAHAIWAGTAQQQAGIAHSRSSSSSVTGGVRAGGGTGGRSLSLSRMTEQARSTAGRDHSLANTCKAPVAAQGAVWLPVSSGVVLLSSEAGVAARDTPSLGQPVGTGHGHGNGLKNDKASGPPAALREEAVHSHRVSALDVPPPVESEKPGAPVLPPPPAAVPEPAEQAAHPDIAPSNSEGVPGPVLGQGIEESAVTSTASFRTDALPKVTSMASTASTLSSTAAASTAVLSPEAAKNMDVADWKAQIKPLLAHYAILTPGAYVSESLNTLTFHYGASDPDQGEWTARELLNHLQASTASVPLEIALAGSASDGRASRSLQVRIRGTSLCDALHLVLQRMHDTPREGGTSLRHEAVVNPSWPVHMVVVSTDEQDKAGLAAIVTELRNVFISDADGDVRKGDIPVVDRAGVDTAVFVLRDHCAADTYEPHEGSGATGSKGPGVYEALSILAREAGLSAGEK